MRRRNRRHKTSQGDAIGPRDLLPPHVPQDAKSVDSLTYAPRTDTSHHIALQPDTANKICQPTPQRRSARRALELSLTLEEVVIGLVLDRHPPKPALSSTHGTRVNFDQLGPLLGPCPRPWRGSLNLSEPGTLQLA